MNRRSFIGTSALAGAGALIVSQTGCGASIATEIGIIQSTALALKSLLPNQSALLDKVSRLAGDFSAAYKRGDFASAKVTFESLDANISALLSDIGGASPRIQFLVGIVSIALHAVAALFIEAPASTTSAMSAAAPAMADRIRVLGSAEAAAKLLQNVK